jgi:hypothetical protein
MALVECPECKRQISSSAAQCPNCGFPMAHHLQSQATAASRQADTARLQRAVFESLVRGAKPAFLSTINTGGFKMFGFYPVAREGDRVLGLSVHAFCLFFFPLIPSGIYLIEPPQGQQYRFHGRVPFSACWQGLGGAGTIRLLGSVFLEGMFGIVAIVVVFGGLFFVLSLFKGC